MQNEITKPTDLLNIEGNIAEPGFAKKMLYNYNRENVTAELSSAAGKVCLVCEGSLLAPRRETVRAILSEDCAELSADLAAGNYSYSACMFVPRENAESGTDT